MDTLLAVERPDANGMCKALIHYEKGEDYARFHDVTAESVPQLLKQLKEDGVDCSKAVMEVTHKQCLEMLARKAVGIANKDRYALILSQRWFGLLRKEHTILLYMDRLYKCTGVLIRMKFDKPKTVYHLTWARNVETILRDGIKASEDDGLTYGGGVVYGYLDRGRFMGNGGIPEDKALIAFATKRLLYSLIRYGVEGKYQHEVCVLPKDIERAVVVK